MSTSTRTFAQSLGTGLLSLGGWQVDIPEPLPPKCVIIGAHHTSGVDLALILFTMLATGLRFNWVAKDTLFPGALGMALRKLGGISVNRRIQGNFVQQMVDEFGIRNKLQLAIAPEGTRKHSGFWKTGFYHIAQGAGVPLILGYGDYRRKVVGTGPLIEPSGDIVADMNIIRTFYADITARHPDKQGTVQLRQRQ